MNTSPHVVYPDQVAPYQPANHTGTSNRRIIGRDTVGARRLEVLIGTISKGHGAQRHAHPSLEQASYLLRGAGVSEVYGQERHISAGDWGFSPKGVFHSFTVTSEEPAQVLVVYAPPYQENPRAVIVHNPAHPQPEPRPPVTIAVAPVAVCWEGTEGARVETIVDTACSTSSRARSRGRRISAPSKRAPAAWFSFRRGPSGSGDPAGRARRSS